MGSAAVKESQSGVAQKRKKSSEVHVPVPSNKPRVKHVAKEGEESCESARSVTGGIQNY